MGDGAEALLNLFSSRLSELGGEAVSASMAEAVGDLQRSCNGCRSILTAVPEAVEKELSGWLAGLRLIDGRSTPLSEAASADACITTSEHLIAESGSVAIITRSLEEMRATVLPDRLFVLALNPVIYRRVYDFAAAALRSLIGPNAALTLFSGPSSTGDVENVRVRGVHGPRYIKVYVVGEVRAWPTAGI